MMMTPEQIKISYKEAKHKDKQIGILAELNDCEEYRIVAILMDQGISPKELKANRRQQSNEQENEDHARNELPDIVKEAITKLMIEEQEAIDRHSARLAELNGYLTSRG